MGALISNLFSKPTIPVCLVGLDSAGKTTICYKLKLGETVQTIPTIGFGSENYEIKGMRINVWDVNGSEKVRYLWKHYYISAEAIIYILDSTDRDRFDLSIREFNSLLDSEYLIGCPILIMANKQDLEGAMSPYEITEKLNLINKTNRDWNVQGTCAITGQGLNEGIDWLLNIKTRKGSRLK